MSAPLHAADGGGTNTITIASSATASILMAVIIVVIVVVLMRRKKIQTCAKNRQSSVDGLDTPMEVYISYN